MDNITVDKVFPNLDKKLLKIVQNRIDSFKESLQKSELQIDLNPDLQSDLIKVFLFSEFIASNLTRSPDILNDLIKSRALLKSYSSHTYAVKFEKQIHKEMDAAAVKKILLYNKLYENIRIAWRDLSGRARLEETLEDLSNLADSIVDAAITTLYNEVCARHGIPVDHEGNFQRIIIFGMGKLGAGELNFSSDIDLIFVYPEAGYTNGEKMISNEEFFTKLCRRFLKFFSTDSLGINFYRVDTRLRPYGDGGPIVMSSSGFEEYYQAQGREWERYAMIKARPIAGDLEEGLKLLKIMNSFIYRRYFDYGSFDSFRDMKSRITLQVKSKKLKHNIKLGAGGIREIEFFGQLFQLIRGGVEPKLQERKILHVLDLLQIHKCIDGSTKTDLKESYKFLRMVENRLQIYADLQTHDIPQKEDQQNILALSMGYDSWDSFNNKLNDHMQMVHHHFQQLLVSSEEEKPDRDTHELKELWGNINDPQFTADPKIIGHFMEPDRILNILRSLEAHPNTKNLTPNGRKKLARLIPLLIKKIGEQKNPDAILSQLIDLIVTIERRTCYLSLLIENKSALETLITLAQKSPWIITFLAKHPALLDELMHPATLYSPPGKEALEKEMESRMAGLPPNDLEFQLEQLSVFRQINYLRVSAADVSGDYPLMKVSDHLTYIAQAVLVQVLQISWNIVTQKYGIPEGITGESTDNCGFAIIAYGKVGGFEMGYKSDIDLIFLYNAGSGTTKGREKSIENIRFYSNMGQRIINSLTMHTPAGTLYGADMRLRPGGNSGMVVSHIDAFQDYLENQAWTWEHQALIRARPVAGDKKLCTRFNEIRKDVLTIKRDAEVLKKEVSDMRERMRKERLKFKKDFFDLNQSRGGIVDIEFLVQYLILKNAHDNPDLTTWTDNIRLLESLDIEGIMSGQMSEQLQKVYIVMRKAVHRLNLQEKSQQVAANQFSEITDSVKTIYDQYLS